MASHGAKTEVDRAAKASFDLFAETFSNWRTLASLGSEPVLRIVALGGASPLLSSLSQSDCPPQMHVDAAATLALLCGVEIARQDILQLQGLPRLLAVLQAQTLPDIALAHTLTAIINLSPCDTVLSSLCEQQAVAVCLRLLAHAHPAVVAQASLLLRVVAGDSQNCYAVFLAGTQLLRAVAHVLSRCSDGEALCNCAFLAAALYREIPLFVKPQAKGVHVDGQLVATYDECIGLERQIADACLSHAATSRSLPVVTFSLLCLLEISKNYDSAIYMHAQGAVDAALAWSSMRAAELPPDVAAVCSAANASPTQQLQACVHVAAQVLASLSSVSNAILLEINTKEAAIAKARAGK